MPNRNSNNLHLGYNYNEMHVRKQHKSALCCVVVWFWKQFIKTSLAMDVNELHKNN